METLKIVVGAVGTAALLFAGQIIADRVQDGQGTADEQDVAVRGSYLKSDNQVPIAVRSTDPAGPRADFVRPNQDRNRLQRLADDPRAIGSVTGTEWGPTRVALEDARRFDVEDECRERLNWSEDVEPTCVFSMTSVIGSDGRVVYVHVEETDTHYLTPECSAMAACVAEDRLNMTIVVPSSHVDELAVQQVVRTKPLIESFNDPEYVDDVIALLENDLSTSADLADSPELEIARLQHVNYISYLQARSARLRGGSEGAEQP